MRRYLCVRAKREVPGFESEVLGDELRRDGSFPSQQGD
jgi:hypothetical protein